MKKQIILLGFSALMITAVAFKAVSGQQEKKNEKKEQQQNQAKKQDKGNRADKANPGQKDNKGQPADKKNPQDKQDKNPVKDNEGKNDDISRGKNDMKEGYKWDRETFKDRSKYKNLEKVTLCHKINSNDEPPVTIRVSSNALKAHMNHGDVMGDCPAVTNNRFSDIFLRNRADYYNNLENHYEQVLYSRSILDYALARLTNSRQQLVYLQNNNMPAADIERKRVIVLELEQNVSLLETLIGVAANVVANKLL